MITDKRTEEIRSENKGFSYDHRNEGGHMTSKISVEGHGIMDTHGLSRYIDIECGRKVTKPLIIEASYEINDELLMHASFYKEKISVPEIVIKAKYQHGLAISWTAIQNLFLAFKKVIIDSNKLCLGSYNDAKLARIDGNGTLDISGVSELTLKEFKYAHYGFKHIIYNPQSRSLGMLGIYYHQRLKQSEEEGNRLSNGSGICATNCHIDLSTQSEIRSVAVLWDGTDDSLRITNTSTQPAYIPTLVLFDRGISVHGDVIIGTLFVANGAEAVECSFLNDVTIKHVEIEPSTQEQKTSGARVYFYFNGNARIGRFGTLDNVFRESASVSIITKKKCESVMIDELYVADGLDVMTYDERVALEFGDVFSRNVDYSTLENSRAARFHIKKATLTSSAFRALEHKLRIDELIMPYINDTIYFEMISIGKLVIDARGISMPDTIVALAEYVSAETIQILTDETTKDLKLTKGWIQNSTVGKLYVDGISSGEADTEYHNQQSDWIVKSRLMGIEINGNKVADVPTSITTLKLPDGISFEVFSALLDCKLRVLSVNPDDVYLMTLGEGLKSMRCKIELLEIRQSKKDSNILNGKDREYLQQIVESRNVSRVIVWDKVHLTRAFMYKVRDSQCEVVFKQVVGSVPNVTWRENSRGRVICEKIIGDLSDVLACANKAARKGIIEQSNAIIINARAGKKIDVKPMLEEAKVAVDNRDVYVAIRGKSKDDTVIKSEIYIKGMVVADESTVSLSVVTEHGEGIGKIISYGITNKISGNARIGEVILSKKDNNNAIVIRGRLIIEKITSLFRTKMLPYDEKLALELGSRSDVMQIGEVSELNALAIRGSIQINTIRNIKKLKHNGGELTVQCAEGIGDCSGLGRKTYIKEMIHSGEHNRHSMLGTLYIDSYRADKILVRADNRRIQIRGGNDIFASKLVIEGDIEKLDFMENAEHIDKVVVKGNVGRIHSSFNQWIKGRFFVNGIIELLGGCNPWITESGHFKRCENKGFVYWQGLGE